MVAGCSVLTEPNGYDLPDRDYSLDPAALVESRMLYACGRWRGGVPPAPGKIFVDVAFGRPSAEDPDDGPYERHTALVKRHGGKIVHEFNVPALRVWLETSSIPALAAEEHVMGVFEVVNPSRYDWPVSVGYKASYSHLDGAVQFAELGGRVEHRWNSINAIHGLIPDQVIPVLRNSVHVDYVEGGGWFCISDA